MSEAESVAPDQATLQASLLYDSTASRVTYTRLMCRPVEDYSAEADDLIEEHGEIMAQLLGRRDALNGPDGFIYEHMIQTQRQTITIQGQSKVPE